MNIKTIIATLFKVLAITLSLTVLLPSAVKLSHAFSHHEHEVCTNDIDGTSTHFHELDLDCDFYKFKLNSNYYNHLKLADSEVIENYKTITSVLYVFIRSHEQETTLLRGPPSLV